MMNGTLETNSEYSKFICIVEAYHGFVESSILTVGILTNAITFTTLQRMWMGRICNILITSLCVTDFFCCVFGLESIVLEMLFFGGNMPHGHWRAESVATLSLHYIYLMVLCMSSATVILISVVRNYSLQYPLKATYILKPNRVILFIVATLAFVFLLFMPMPILIMWQSCFKDRKIVHVCQSFYKHLPNAERIKIYFSILSFIFGPVTCTVNLGFWFKIKKAIKQSTRISHKMRQLRSNEEKEQAIKTMRITKMFVYVLIFNTLCIMPFSVQMILMLIDTNELTFNIKSSILAIYDVIVEVCLAMVPCCNFWAYLVINRDFRHELGNMFPCLKCFRTKYEDRRASSNPVTHRTVA